MYEIKGVKINHVCSELLQNVNTNFTSDSNSIHSDTNLHCFPTTVPEEKVNGNCIFYTQSYYIFIYSICFSTIKRCNYWNYQTENAIVEHAVQLFDETYDGNLIHLDTKEHYVALLKSVR